MNRDEAAFQALLDEHPDDHTTRLVFADWLEERGDPRAAGYRALARCGFVLSDRYPGPPVRYIPLHTSRVFRIDHCGTGSDYTLPADWFDALPGATANDPNGIVPFKDRRAAEDAAALAFVTLPPERREQLLAGERG